jgi:hypothetical protein
VRAAAPAAAVTPPRVPAPGAAAAAVAKRGRAVNLPASVREPSRAPLEEKPIEVSGEKLARALAGLLVEKQVITLGELMERVAREG